MKLGTELTKGWRAGTHRRISPAETLARFESQMERMGITRVANVTGLDSVGIPVAVAVRPNSRSNAVFQGKGLDLDAAKASAVMEAAETWHAERIEARMVVSTECSLPGQHGVVDTTRLPRSRHRDFSTDTPIPWVLGHDLITGQSTWVPYELVHADFRAPAPPGSGCFVASTNGLASGNDLTEAIVHAVCEVIERDATTLWELSDPLQDQSMARDLRLDPPLCAVPVLERFEAAGVEVYVWDVTTDIGIPVVHCMAIAEVDADGADPEFGSGCHPSGEVALLRALTEAAQARVTTITGARDDLPASDYHPRIRHRRRVAGDRLRRRFDPPQGLHVVNHASRFLDQDLDWIIGQLRAAELDELVVVDLSCDDVGMAVVRVIVPGLETLTEAEDYTPGARGLAQAQARTPAGATR